MINHEETTVNGHVFKIGDLCLVEKEGGECSMHTVFKILQIQDYGIPQKRFVTMKPLHNIITGGNCVWFAHRLRPYKPYLDKET